MKSIAITLALCILTHSAVAATMPVSIELEVSRCPGGARSFSELEHSVAKPDAPDLRADDFNQAILSKLKPYSPSRARALYEFRETRWTKLKPIKGSILRARLPTTGILQPAGCAPDVVASFTIAATGQIEGELNQDLWQSLTSTTRNILQLEAYLYFENQIWAFYEDRLEQSWSPPALRQFAIGLLSDRSIASVQDFYELARETELPFIEQAGVFVPLLSQVPEFYPHGLVKKTFRRFHLRSRMPGDGGVWQTYFELGSQLIEATSWTPQGAFQSIDFYESGRIHCVPNSNLVTPYRFARFTANDAWNGTLCLTPDGAVERGHLIVSWNSPLKWKFGAIEFTIRRDRTAGGLDQGAEVTFFDDGHVRTIDISEGVVPYRGRATSIRGPLEFERVSSGGASHVRLACARLAHDGARVCFDDDEGGRD